MEVPDILFPPIRSLVILGKTLPTGYGAVPARSAKAFSPTLATVILLLVVHVSRIGDFYQSDCKDHSMTKLILPLITLIAFGSARGPECIRPSSPPNDNNCHEALADMIEDFNNYDREMGELTWVSRIGFVGTDYIVPKSFPRGEGADRCVITVDVDPDSEADLVFLDNMSASTLEVIEQCVEAKDQAKSAGKVIVGEKQVIVVTVGRENKFSGSDHVGVSNKPFQRPGVANVETS